MQNKKVNGFETERSLSCHTCCFVSHSKDLPNFEVFYDKQGVLRTYYNPNTYGIDL